jgi:predicted peroxiredoxin/TusA-related sulfurtransferase
MSSDEATATGRTEVQVVDGRGRSVSTAVLFEVVLVMEDPAAGTLIRVQADPLPALDSDIRAWCQSTGHELVGVEDMVEARQYTIRKVGERRSLPGWAIVISNPGLEELLSPLGFALAAALAGSRVALYFQGPAVRVLSRSFSEKLGGWKRPFSGIARRRLENMGHPTPHVKLRQLSHLGAKIYICGPSMDHFKVTSTEILLPGVQVAAYPTFVGEMNAAGVHVFLQ